MCREMRYVAELILRSNAYLSKKGLGQMKNGQMTYFFNYIFGQMTLFHIFLVSRPFDKTNLLIKWCLATWRLGQITFRSNGDQSNSVTFKRQLVKIKSIK
jgi:hypothetical protein